MDIDPSGITLQETWGLLGPARLDASRRTRALNVAAAIRRFNELAVPGLGNLWFGKSLLWAATGIRVAKATRRRNIEVANAVEAISCWYTLQRNSGRRDPRIRGITKLPGRQNLMFELVRKPGFYVTQPFRQGTVEALQALGFVESIFTRRFNSFSLSNFGSQFLDAAFDSYRPNKRAVCDVLQDWVTGSVLPGAYTKLGEALQATEHLSQAARELLRNALVVGTEESAARRRSAIAWVQRVRKERTVSSSWLRRPAEMQEDHWRDLRVGASFFAVRDQAIAVLNALEAQIRRRQDQTILLSQPVPSAVVSTIEQLRILAKKFLNEKYDPTMDAIATRLCKDCTDRSNARVLELLVRRDQRVLRLRDSNTVVPGPAFVRYPPGDEAIAEPSADAGQEVPLTQDLTWPPDISHRITNLYLLDADLDGALDRQLLRADQ